MPQIGDRIRGSEIGRGQHVHIYTACPDCGYARWMSSVHIRRSHGRCRKCAGIAKTNKPNLLLRGANSSRWKGGRNYTVNGYIQVPLYREDPFIAMGKECGNQYSVAEHRIVMARHLGRCLEPWEVVHHKNGLKDDNRIENLELFAHQTAHVPSILLRQEVNKLRMQVKILEARITLLEAERVLAVQEFK